MLLEPGLVFVLILVSAEGTQGSTALISIKVPDYRVGGGGQTGGFWVTSTGSPGKGTEYCDAQKEMIEMLPC